MVLYGTSAQHQQGGRRGTTLRGMAAICDVNAVGMMRSLSLGRRRHSETIDLLDIEVVITSATAY